MLVSHLYIYPIKSLAGISLQEAKLSDRGFEYDRRWMLIDGNNRFLSQREHPKMALLKVSIDEDGLVIQHKQHPEDILRIPGPVSMEAAAEALAQSQSTGSSKGSSQPSVVSSQSPAVNPQSSTVLSQPSAGYPQSPAVLPQSQTSSPSAPLSSSPVTIWDDTCDAIAVSPQADAWFTRVLGMPCRLVYMPEQTRREVDPNYASNHEITSFSDGYPLLIIGQSSLDHLNDKLEKPLPMDRFRPNIVFTGGSPHQEDDMKHFTISDIHFFGVKLCARCVMTLIDQETAIMGKEPLRTLKSYRQQNNKILFGQNLLFKGSGTIRVGDQIQEI